MACKAERASEDMSRRRMPWYRAYSALHTNEDYALMSLEQQGVYHNLRDYAGEQNPRGTFQVKNLEALSRRVAAGRVDILQSVLDYCTTEWLGEDGTPHMVIADGRGRFTTWERWQRTPSEEPEAVAERQDRFQRSKTGEPSNNNADSSNVKRTNNGHITDLRRRSKKQEEDKDVEGKKEDVEQDSHEDRGADFNEIAAILDLQGERRSEGALARSLDRHKDRPDLIDQAEAWAVKLGGERLTPGRRVTSFGEWLDRLPPEESPGWDEPEELPPTNTHPWKLTQGQVAARLGANFTRYFRHVGDTTKGNALVLTWSDPSDREWVEAKYARIISEALDDAGYPEMTVEYQVLGAERAAS